MRTINMTNMKINQTMRTIATGFKPIYRYRYPVSDKMDNEYDKLDKEYDKIYKKQDKMDQEQGKEYKKIDKKKNKEQDKMDKQAGAELCFYLPDHLTAQPWDLASSL